MNNFNLIGKVHRGKTFFSNSPRLTCYPSNLGVNPGLIPRNEFQLLVPTGQQSTDEKLNTHQKDVVEGAYKDAAPTTRPNMVMFGEGFTEPVPSTSTASLSPQELLNKLNSKEQQFKTKKGDIQLVKEIENEQERKANKRKDLNLPAKKGKKLKKQKAPNGSESGNEEEDYIFKF